MSEQKESKGVVAIFGYGQGVSSAYLEGFVEAGYSVAILARTKSKLDKTAEKWKDKGGNVQGFVCDLSKTGGIADTVAEVIKAMGSIDVAIYNATTFVVGWDSPVDEVQRGVDVSITSMQVVFRELLPAWQKSKKGCFLLSGGGYTKNGAWSVPAGHEFGSAVKAYFKNFAEAASAKFSEEGINVCCLTICDLVFGGENIKGEPEAFGKTSEAAAKFRTSLTAAAVKAATADKDQWVAEVEIV